MASVSPIPVSSTALERSNSQTSSTASFSSTSTRGRTPEQHSTMSTQRDQAGFPPGDARGMSPRRSEPECGELEKATRQAVKAHAQEMQKALSDIAESIKMVQEDYEKLEKQNMALQDYIGNLTRSVGREAPGSRKKSGKKSRA